MSFAGPLCEATAAIFEEVCLYRDAFILQHALDIRASDSEVAEDTSSLSLLLAMTVDTRLPKRYQLSETEYVMRHAKFHGVAKRQLLKQVHQAWKALGAKMPRGQTFPVASAEQLNEIQQMLTSKVAA